MIRQMRRFGIVVFESVTANSKFPLLFFDIFWCALCYKIGHIDLPTCFSVLSSGALRAVGTGNGCFDHMTVMGMEEITYNAVVVLDSTLRLFLHERGKELISCEMHRFWAQVPSVLGRISTFFKCATKNRFENSVVSAGYDQAPVAAISREGRQHAKTPPICILIDI
uniref:Uncharacterized protein n=1 Tax=Parascaris equorum TaxID=6256 RepID=A0A914S8Y9_PAREQ